MAKDFLVVMSNEELNGVDGGLIPQISAIAYAVDMYDYYKETKYVASYNDTVVEAGYYDMVKPNPTKPEYNPLYIFTR